MLNKPAPLAVLRDGLRAALEADIPHLVSIDRMDYGRWGDAAFATELRTAWSHTWVLDDSPGLGAFMVVWRVCDEVQVLNLAVRKASRRRGLASRLLTALFEQALQWGARQVILEVRSSNGAARQLYQRHGFLQTGVRRGYYADTREDAILLARAL